MPRQSWPHRHPPSVCSSRLMCPSSIHPPFLPPTIYLFIYSSVHPLPSIHPPPFCLSLTIHPSTIQLLPSIHLSTHHSFIYYSIHPPTILPSFPYPPTLPPFLYPSAVHPSIHHPPMGACIPPFLHSSTHRPFIYHSFIYLLLGH